MEWRSVQKPKQEYGIWKEIFRRGPGYIRELGDCNFCGSCFPFVADKIKGEKPDLKVVGCEPMACPTLTKGLYLYDFGDCAGMTPLLKMFTLGHTFVPPPIHAGGLRYHGDAPLLCKLVKQALANLPEV